MPLANRLTIDLSLALFPCVCLTDAAAAHGREGGADPQKGAIDTQAWKVGSRRSHFSSTSACTSSLTQAFLVNHLFRGAAAALGRKRAALNSSINRDAQVADEFLVLIEASV